MKKVTAKAPINIALIKYWGKSDEENIIPYNSSISLTLDNLYTITSIEESYDGFSFILNDEIIAGREQNKVYEFLKYFADIKELENIKVISKNYVPTAAGLASSASAFAALAVCANSFFNKNYSLSELSNITRHGSGSACRSLLDGFVAWEKNGDVYKVNSKFNYFVMISVIIDDTKKRISSSVGMARSVKTAPLYKYYVKESKEDFENFKKALETGDLKLIGELTKKSFLMMHSMMLSSFPPIIYMKDKSVEVINIVNELLIQGIYAYPTMDAGANVKILTTEDDYQKVILSLEEKGFLDYYISRAGEGARLINE